MQQWRINFVNCIFGVVVLPDIWNIFIAKRNIFIAKMRRIVLIFEYSEWCLLLTALIWLKTAINCASMLNDRKNYFCCATYLSYRNKNQSTRGKSLFFPKDFLIVSVTVSELLRFLLPNDIIF